MLAISFEGLSRRSREIKGFYIFYKENRIIPLQTRNVRNRDRVFS